MKKHIVTIMGIFLVIVGSSVESNSNSKRRRPRLAAQRSQTAPPSTFAERVRRIAQAGSREQVGDMLKKIRREERSLFGTQARNLNIPLGEILEHLDETQGWRDALKKRIENIESNEKTQRSFTVPIPQK